MKKPSKFRYWALKRLCPGAYRKMTFKKKIYFWLESLCSYEYGAAIRSIMVNKRSPSRLEWALYQVPWYMKYISKLEFKCRKWLA